MHDVPSDTHGSGYELRAPRVYGPSPMNSLNCGEPMWLGSQGGALKCRSCGTRGYSPSPGAHDQTDPRAGNHVFRETPSQDLPLEAGPTLRPSHSEHHCTDNCFGRLRILFGHELDRADARPAPFCRNDEGRRELNSNVRHVRPEQALPTFRFSGFWQSYAPLLQQSERIDHQAEMHRPLPRVSR
jgi:hypothetical protein